MHIFNPLNSNLFETAPVKHNDYYSLLTEGLEEASSTAADVDDGDGGDDSFRFLDGVGSITPGGTDSSVDGSEKIKIKIQLLHQNMNCTCKAPHVDNK